MSLEPISAKELRELFAKTQAEISQRNIREVCAGIYRGVLHYAASRPDTRQYRIRVYQHNFNHKETGEVVEAFYMTFPVGENMGSKTTMSFILDNLPWIVSNLQTIFIDCSVEFVRDVEVGDIVEDHIVISWA